MNLNEEEQIELGKSGSTSWWSLILGIQEDCGELGRKRCGREAAWYRLVSEPGAQREPAEGSSSPERGGGVETGRSSLWDGGIRTGEIS